MRTLVVDDNALIRAGLRVCLEDLDDAGEVLEAGDGATAVEVARSTPVDAVLLDVRMPVMDGLTALPQLLATGATVVMLTSTDDLAVAAEAMRQGAAGYIVHGSLPPEAIRDAVRACVAGGTVTAGLSPWDLVAAGATAVAPPSEDLLSPREREVMDLVATGASNRAIASRLVLAEKTVKNHVHNIFAKLGVVTRAEAVAVWHGSGPVGPGPAGPGRDHDGPSASGARSARSVR